jgi:hypothetical protein
MPGVNGNDGYTPRKRSWLFHSIWYC